MESIDLSLLISLDALLQEESVTAAARRVGLSTPAMSHALSRIRVRLHDPMLVRSGRNMVLTPRALELRPQIHRIVSDARQALRPQGPFVAEKLSKTFVVHATDHVVTMFGATVDRILREKAPHVCLRFLPNSNEDAVMLRDKGSDMAIGIYSHLPQELRIKRFFTDHFVVVSRRKNPLVGRRLSLEQFVSLRHVQIAPRDQLASYLDDVLRERGLSRTVARAMPYFLPALNLVAETNYVLTVSRKIAERYQKVLDLRLLKVPVALKPYTLSLIWHPKFDADPSHHFLREVLMQASKEVTGENIKDQKRDKPEPPQQWTAEGK